jgi:alcohol dehydrogenase, propanol-preferring
MDRSVLPNRYLAMALVDGARPLLQPIERPMPALAPPQLRLSVLACGVCRTDLHIVDGELPAPRLPCVPGHEIVGRVVELGPGCRRFRVGDRVGVPWLHGTCQQCAYCESGRENLCDGATFTGWSVDGGYAQYAVCNEDYSVALPSNYSDVDAAPLLCAGLIGYRALRMLPAAASIGLYGFGAAAHLIAQVALQQGRRVAAFTRPGDDAAQALARSLGVQWAGDSTQAPPAPLDGAVLFAPAGELVPRALEHVAPGGTVVCAGIHMSDIPTFAYRLLWKERCVRSVANLTRRDAQEFMAFAADHTLALSTRPYALAQANEALGDLRSGRFAGAAVLRCGET